MISTAVRLLRPISARTGSTFLLKQTFKGQARLLSSSCPLRTDKSEGNPFSSDNIILDASKEHLENLPDPEPQQKKEPTFNVDEMILNSTAADGEGDPTKMFNVDDEEGEYMDDDDIASQILNVALEFVPTHGWSQQSIDAAVDALELSVSTSGMFKRGAVDLVLHFIEISNSQLFEFLASESKRYSTDISGKGTAEFIEKAIQERLKMIIPFIDSWPQALTLIASPSLAPEVLEQGANMVDEIWFHAGDMSTDMSWYSKRAVVAALHLSTELYMLQDKSPNYEDTWNFLNRRMKEIESVKVCQNSLEHAVKDALNLAGAGFTTAQNILGLNNRNR